MASLLGPPRKSNRKRRRNRKLISFSNSPTNSTTISIWRTRRSNLPSRSFRTVLMRSRKTRTGRCRWPSNGTTKPRKSRLTTWIQFHKCRLDSSETLIGRASTHTNLLSQRRRICSKLSSRRKRSRMKIGTVPQLQAKYHALSKRRLHLESQTTCSRRIHSLRVFIQICHLRRF